MAISSSTNNILASITRPNYIKEIRLMKDVPSVEGIVLEIRVTGLVRVHGGVWEEHDWDQSMNYLGELPDAVLVNWVKDQIKDIPRKMEGIKNYYSRWDYDEAGNEIPGTERRTYFDKWVLIDSAIEGEVK